MLSAKLKEAAGNSADATLYVDDVFSTYLYTGNGSTQTITNGIDLAGKGGLVWIKLRSGAQQHNIYDSARSWDTGGELITNTTDAAQDQSSGYFSVSSTGFSLPSGVYNTSAATYASWTFRKAAKFFDTQTVTHTNGTANNIDLSVLGTVGMVIAKITTTTGAWTVWQRSLTASNNLKLNTTAAQSTTDAWLSVSGTTATLSASAPTGTYVIYAYAHDTSSTGFIQCGSFTSNVSSDVSVNLGWEPQYVLFKITDAVGSWKILDTMRGWNYQNDSELQAQSSSSETTTEYGEPTATGFNVRNLGTHNYIYMAIRRPNKPPTTGSQVFSPIASANGTDTVLTTAFPIDLQFLRVRNSGGGTNWFDRLRGTSTGATSIAAPYIDSQGAAAESSGADLVNRWNNTGFSVAANWGTAPDNMVYENFKRAPGFFDVVCYTGTGTTGQTYNHNLTVVPEMMIVKSRSVGSSWYVYVSSIGNTNTLVLNSTAATAVRNVWGDTTPTSSVFSVGVNGNGTNNPSQTYVAYLFATLAGISKVGSYTGNGTGQAIACGFGSGGARFVLIKRTDSTGDWYTFDSARGLTSGSSPYLLLNSTAAETTGNNGVYASSGGFTLGATAITTTNIATATYIYLSVA